MSDHTWQMEKDGERFKNEKTDPVQIRKRGQMFTHMHMYIYTSRPLLAGHP